ncbi:MAG: helix-turn-helix transcriptional regulator [Chloroflexi bacterium]|nr:helix-turn-helix transcriptional regulator [Chloroflexota bacterium]
MSAFTPDTAILGLLAARRRHGYQLLECFNDPQHLGRVWRLSTSQLYNVLKRLERKSLIVGDEIPSEIGPSARRVCADGAGPAAGHGMAGRTYSGDKHPTSAAGVSQPVVHRPRTWHAYCRHRDAPA